MTRRMRSQEIRGRIPVNLPDYTENGALIHFPRPDSLLASQAYSQEGVKRRVKLHRGKGMSIAGVLAGLEREGLFAPMIEELEGWADRLM